MTEPQNILEPENLINQSEPNTNFNYDKEHKNEQGEYYCSLCNGYAKHHEKHHGQMGGTRSGAGRPKGSENEATKLRKEQEALMRERIVKSTDALLNAQMQLAKGESSLYRIYYTGKGATRKKVVEIVIDQDTITEYLADTLEPSEDEYYYIATKSPDNRSIDSLLDRTYGKATNNIDLKGTVTYENPLAELTADELRKLASE